MSSVDTKAYGEKLSAYLHEVSNVINEIGSTYHGTKHSEMGVVKMTYMTISEKTSRNMHGILTLLKDESNHIDNNRQPIMLLLRGILDDLILGAYLIPIIGDETSFKNELNVISTQYAKFIEYYIERQPVFSFDNQEYAGMGSHEIQAEVKAKIAEFRAKNPQLYKDDGLGGTVKKNNKELRDTTTTPHLRLRSETKGDADWMGCPYKTSLLSEIIEFIGIGDNLNFQIHSYAYVMYRLLSQYEHFSLDLTLNVLNRDKNFEISIIHKSIVVIHMIIMKQLQILGITADQIERLDHAIDKYGAVNTK